MSTKTTSRAELVQAFIPESPFVGHLGMQLTALEQDRVEMVLPFREELATIGDVVHGGAISTLIDTAGMAAAWADTGDPGGRAGSTIGLTVDFVAAARGEDVTAEARVVRRGQSLCFCEVEARGESGQVVAKGLVTHRFA
jgi:uncharacterized protein (TIGR00369 family)